jgi:hypothetical protein
MPMTMPMFTRYVLAVLGIAVAALFVWKISPVLMLFFAGVVLATAVRAGSVPLSRRFGLSETLSAAIVFALVIAFIVTGDRRANAGAVAGADGGVAQSEEVPRRHADRRLRPGGSR